MTTKQQGVPTLGFIITIHIDIDYTIQPALHIWPTSAVNCINAIPLIAFALNFAWCYVDVFSNMKNNQVQTRVNVLVITSHSTVLINYLFLAIIGYLSYCSYADANILQSL
eukprot:Pgem_evm1s11424